MTTYSLFLDDERYPSDVSRENWVICRNFHEALEMFVSCVPDHISFDHDLGYLDQQDFPPDLRRSQRLLSYEVGPSGYDFAKWLVEYDMDQDVLTPDFRFSVHSMNPIGSNNITEYLHGYLENKFGPGRAAK